VVVRGHLLKFSLVLADCAVEGTELRIVVLSQRYKFVENLLWDGLHIGGDDPLDCLFAVWSSLRALVLPVVLKLDSLKQGHQRDLEDKLVAVLIDA